MVGKVQFTLPTQGIDKRHGLIRNMNLLLPSVKLARYQPVHEPSAEDHRAQGDGNQDAGPDQPSPSHEQKRNSNHELYCQTAQGELQ